MTFEELVKKVAKSNSVSETKTRDIINEALKLTAKAALDGKAPFFKVLGQIVTVPVRTTGRKPDGSTWTMEPRIKFALRTSRKHAVKSAASSAAA